MTLKLNREAMEFEGLAARPTDELRALLRQAVEFDARDMAREIRAVLLVRESARVTAEELATVPQFDEGRLFMGMHEPGANKQCDCTHTLFDHRQLRFGQCVFCLCPGFAEI